MTAKYIGRLMGIYRNAEKFRPLIRYMWRYVFPRIYESATKGNAFVIFLNELAPGAEEELVKKGYIVTFDKKKVQTIVRWE